MLHVGVHDEPLARELVQVPTAPLVGAVDASHGVAVQAAVSVRVPLLHDLEPETVYPVSQVGVHDEPLARVDVQSFRAPLVMAPDASHGVAVQAAVSVRVPLLHDLEPETVYPVSQVGVHDEPLARVDVQSFRAPLVMAPDASQGGGEQAAVSVRVPQLHDLEPETVYPVSQVGVHDEPLARVDVQSFRAPLVMAPDASQGGGETDVYTRT